MSYCLPCLGLSISRQPPFLLSDRSSAEPLDSWEGGTKDEIERQGSGHNRSIKRNR